MAGINLHYIVRSSITNVHPDESIVLFHSTGQSNTDGIITPTYSDGLVFSAQVQPNSQSLQHSDNVNITPITRRIYLFAPEDSVPSGIIRPDGRTGDMIFRPRDSTWWLITAVNEEYSSVGWELVTATQQEAPPHGISSADIDVDSLPSVEPAPYTEPALHVASTNYVNDAVALKVSISDVVDDARSVASNAGKVMAINDSGLLDADITGNAATATTAGSAGNAVNDANGNSISATYATKSEAQNYAATAASAVDIGVKSLSGVNDVLTVVMSDEQTKTITVNNVAHAASADSATVAASATTAVSATSANTATRAEKDGSGNVIVSTYATKASAITGLSVSGQTITFSRGDGTTGTLTTQDTTYSVFGVSDGLVPSRGSTVGTTRYLREDGSWQAPPGANYDVATTTTNGLMSAVDKTKLDGIEPGANAYTHPTGSGYNHIPSGGSSGKILRWNADGVAVWDDEHGTTYNPATATTDGLMSATDKVKLDGIANGANNYVLPIATASALGGVKVGTNLSINSTTGVLSATDTTYSAVTSSTDGLMTASDKVKLDGIASGANAYVLPIAGANVLGGVKVGANLSVDAAGVLSATDTTYSVATTTADGLMSSADKTTLNAISSTYAPIASPALTGTPTAPTAAAGTSTTQIATTAFVQAAIAAITDADNVGY